MTRSGFSKSAQALGRVSQWDTAKGLGFVQPDGGGERLLLRRADLQGRLRTREPQVGEPLRFCVSQDQRRALQVHSTAPPPAPVAAAPRAGGPNSNRLLVIPVFALLLGALHWEHPLPRAVPTLYSALSMALVLVYGMDKWAARRGAARVAPWSLHVVAVMGGWPGALIGQQLFRHKTTEPLFLRITWAMAALNIALLLLAWTTLF